MSLMNVGAETRVLWVFYLTSLFPEHIDQMKTPDTSHAYFPATLVSMVLWKRKSNAVSISKTGVASTGRIRFLTYQKRVPSSLRFYHMWRIRAKCSRHVVFDGIRRPSLR